MIKENGDTEAKDTIDSKINKDGETNSKDVGEKKITDARKLAASNSGYSTIKATGELVTKETMAKNDKGLKKKGDGYSKTNKTKDSGNLDATDSHVKDMGLSNVNDVKGVSVPKIGKGIEISGNDVIPQKEQLLNDAKGVEVKEPNQETGIPSVTEGEVVPVHKSGETADKKANDEDTPIENKRVKFGGIFSRQPKRTTGKTLKAPVPVKRSIISPRFITEKIIGKRKMKTGEPSTPNDKESNNSDDKKTKVDPKTESVTLPLSSILKKESKGKDGTGSTADNTRPSLGLVAANDISKITENKPTVDKNLTDMSVNSDKSVIKNGAVSEKDLSGSAGSDPESKNGNDTPSRLSNADLETIEQLKSLRSEISKLDDTEGDDNDNGVDKKDDDETKDKERGGVQRSRSLVAITAEENFLIVRGQTPRSESSLSLNAKSTKGSETQGDKTDSTIHSQKPELKSDSKPTNEEAGGESKEQTDQSGPKEQTALDQSIPGDGEKGSLGAEGSGGKASTEGSGEKSDEGSVVRNGGEKEGEKEGKEEGSDIAKGKEEDSDKVPESEINLDRVSESDKNGEKDEDEEDKTINVKEEEPDKANEKTGDVEKVNDEKGEGDKGKENENDTEKVENDDKEATKAEAQDKASDKVKEGETKEGGQTEDKSSDKKDGGETEEKDKTSDKKDESTDKDGEEKATDTDDKSPNNRGDVIVEALEESARSNTGDLAGPSPTENTTGETDMPFHLKPRGPSMASVERPENVISTVSMAVAHSVALGAGNRTIGLGDHLPGGRGYFDRLGAPDSLWQRSQGPLEVKPPGESNRQALYGKDSLDRMPYMDDDMAQWNNKVKESRGAQTARIKNQEVRHSILKTTDAKYGNAINKKDEIRTALKDKALPLSEPIIIASGIVPESLEYLTSEYQALNNKLNGTTKTANSTNPTNKGNGNNQIGNKNNKVAFNNAHDNLDAGNNYYNINNSYNQTGVAGYNAFNNANNKLGTNMPPGNGLITAPLVAPQHKVEDVFERLHSNKKSDRNSANATVIANAKADVPPKGPVGKEPPLDAKATMKAAAKTAATGNAVVAAVNNNKNNSASEANRKNLKNTAGGGVGGGVGVGGGGGGPGGDVFSRLYQTGPKKQGGTVTDDKTPSDDAKKDGTKNPVRANAKGIANAKKGQGDSVINMPLPSDKKEKATIGLTPDIVVDDTGGPVPIHGVNMGQGGQSGDPTKIPIVMLQGFFRGPGSKSPHHRRPSLVVSEMALPPDLVDVTSMIRGALPVLPRSLAALCLTLNIVVPGLGTMLSGWLGICWGRNRLAPVETGGTRMTSVVVTGVTGLVQLFTVTFFLVGWFWGVAWGILLVSISNKYASFCSEHRSSISGSVNLEMLTVNAS
ncbi:uncharacterized protein [Palaemon carinicauda]|uniref:uncharacterized protein n=1 Tax=Palaemon carinicauda TaxID=392227 RepID=UPI0035B5E6D1